MTDQTREREQWAKMANKVENKAEIENPRATKAKREKQYWSRKDKEKCSPSPAHERAFHMSMKAINAGLPVSVAVHFLRGAYKLVPTQFRDRPHDNCPQWSR